MPEIVIKEKRWKCNKCHHVWKNRNERKPKLCPKCKSVNWDE